SFGMVRRRAELAASPGISALAFGLGSCLVIPYLWTAITTGRRIDVAREEALLDHDRNIWVAAGLLAASALVCFSAGAFAGVMAVATVVAAQALTVTALVLLQISLNELWRWNPGASEPPAGVELTPAAA